MTSKRLLELIDACQPSSNDLDEADLRELTDELSRNPQLHNLFDQSQQLDLSIREGFQGVTPPAGLVERLVEAVESGSGDFESDALETEEPIVELPKRESRNSRRWWIGAAALVAIAVIVFIQMRAPSNEWLKSETAIASRIDQWNAQANVGEWQAVDEKPLAEFPSWGRLKIDDRVRWRWITKNKVVCYEWSLNHDGDTARLFVMEPGAAVGLPKTPPVGYPSGAGWHVGTWQANGRVYFLAVQAGRNSKRVYSQLVTVPTA